MVTKTKRRQANRSQHGFTSRLFSWRGKRYCQNHPGNNKALWGLHKGR